MSEPIRSLISACPLGEKVRCDGGHERDAFLAETLGRFVERVFCLRRWRDLRTRNHV